MGKLTEHDIQVMMCIYIQKSGNNDKKNSFLTTHSHMDEHSMIKNSHDWDCDKPG